jgi:putative flippase GtrA
MTLMKTLYVRWQVVVHEIAKFGIVGAFNTVLHFGLFNLLRFTVGLGPLTANGLAIAVAATSSYVMNRHWTFRHRARTGVGREYSLFFLLNGVGMVISEACVGFTHYVLGQTSALALNAALAAGVGLGMVFRFTAYKRWVFMSRERAAGRSLAEGSVAEVAAAEVAAAEVAAAEVAAAEVAAAEVTVTPGPGVRR